MMKPLVLIIDNDLAFRETLRDGLLKADFHAFIANADSAMSSALRRLKPDALLINADPAVGAAFAQVSRLRQDPEFGHLPIVMYAASAALSDKARGLDAGADDFLISAFAVEDVATRIHGLLRHAGNTKDGGVIEIGGLRVDMRGYSVTHEGRAIDLSQTSFSILCLLLRQPDTVLTRRQISDAVWGEHTDIHERSIDVSVNRLRLSLGGEARNMIKTVRGIGYKFSARSSLPSAMPSLPDSRGREDSRLRWAVGDAAVFAF